MAYRWPEETVGTRLARAVEELWCRTWGGTLPSGAQRHHGVFTLNGPVPLVGKLAHGPAHAGPAPTQPRSPAAETTITRPGWGCRVWAGAAALRPPLVSGQPRRPARAAPSHMPLSDEALARSIPR